MASKTVQPIAIKLGIEGGEKLAALNRSFRDLSKQVKLSDSDITQATKDIVKFATEAGNSEATIKGQIKAFEGLREQAALGGKAYTELTQGISKLQSTLRGSSDAVERERSNLVKLGSASKNSAKDLQYVIGQLEKLKSKVREDSAAFLQLGKDIKNLSVNLKEVEISAGKARFAINTILSAKPEKITGQIEKLSAAIASGTLEAEDLNIALRKLELLRVGAGRGPVAFRADVFSSQLGVDYFARLRKEYDNLEKTQAAITQRISEVNTELQNVSGYERRRSLTLELIRLNKELQQSIVNVTTREQFQAMAIRQRMGSARESYAASGFGAFSAEIRQRTAGGEFTPGMQRARGRAEESARERRELEQIAQLQQEINRLEGEYVDSARSAVQTIQNLQLKRHEEFMSQIAAEDAAQKKAFQEQQSREEREYQRRVAIGRQMRTGEFASRRLIGMPNQELSQLYGGIVRIGQADQTRQLEMMGRGYDEVANDIRKVTAASNGSVSSLNAQRSAWSSLRDILDPASQQFKKVTGEIERVDKALEKTQRRRRGMSPMQMTQAAGAAISGGIFGGPEGFLGGAIGAIGGVGGAFAGAAIGAQVGGLRRQLGEFADYAAQIQKLQIALRGVAGSQVEFNRAMAAASSVTEELNVPQDVAIQGMTRLTAAVKGAGGGVADAELAFRNINSAIIATGGGAEQVEGAVTALVQIFSKGKVSAEEINQIAERLPGTFNKIAAASGRTGPELTKALQDGKVGLNDLMKFLVQLGGDYNVLAEKIAQSSESAGARLQVAYDKMRQEVGKALQPIGAEFQAAFAEFIQDITPELVSAAKAVGDGLRFIIQNREAITVAASFALKLAAVNLALKAFAAFNGPVSAMFTLLRTGFKATSQQAALAQTKLAAFGRTVKALAVSLAAPIVITFAVVGAEMVIAYFNRIKKARADLEATAKKPQGEVFFSSIGGTAATKQTLQRNINDITKNLDILRDRVKSTKKELQSLEDTARTTYGGGGGGLPVEGVTDRSREDLKTRLQADEAEIKRLVLNYKTLVDRYIAAPDAAAGLTDFPSPVTEEKGGAGGDKAARDAERRAEEIARLKRSYDLLFAKRQILTVDMQLLDAARFTDQAQKESNAEAVDALRRKQSDLVFEKDLLAAKIEYDGTAREIRETLEGQQRAIAESTAEEQLRQSINVALGEQMSRNLTIEQDITDEKKKQRQAIEAELTDRKRALGLISDDEYNAALMERESRRLREQFPREAQAPQRAELLDLYRQEIDPTPFEKVQQNITQLKRELGELVKSANQITGAATAIGDAFSKAFVDAISGASTAKEALASFFQSVGSYFLDMAKQIIAKMIQIAILNSVAKLLPGSPGGFSLGGTPFGAGGGEVGGIGTLGPNFGIAQRASGGPVMPGNTYMVGERGPELLTMTPSGGYVTSNSASQAAMDRYSSGNTRGGSISVNYNVTEINGMKFVTEDQFRAGISQAAKQGAEGGFNRTMTSLKNSRSTRSRVGV